MGLGRVVGRGSLTGMAPMIAVQVPLEMETVLLMDGEATDTIHDTGPPLPLPQFRPARLPDPQLPDEAKTR